jgi:hypothetical protein
MKGNVAANLAGVASLLNIVVVQFSGLVVVEK